MYLERVDVLPQGTPVFEVEAGYKNCKAPGRYRATRFDGKLVCPGCEFLCGVQAVYQMAPGDSIIVRKRPKPTAPKR